MAFVFFKKIRMTRAIKKGDAGKVAELIDRGIDPDLKIHSRNTFLAMAIQANKRDVAHVLIARGADCTRVTNDGSYLHAIVRQTGDIGMLNVFLDARLDLLKSKDAYGNTLLHIAAKTGKMDVISFLLSKGLDPLCRNSRYETPRIVARRHDRQKAEDLLLMAERAANSPIYWIKLDPRKIARITLETATGYKITEIFNFLSRESLKIACNLKTQTDSPPETRCFDDITDKAPLEKALAVLNQMGGSANPDSISGLFKSKLKPYKLQVPPSGQ